MRLIYPFLCIVLLNFGFAEAYPGENDEFSYRLNRNLESLDFSESHPNLQTLEICQIYFTPWGERIDNGQEMAQYYCSQATDLGLSHNLNLRTIEVLSPESVLVLPFFEICYLPLVKEFRNGTPDYQPHCESLVRDYKFLCAFPNLESLISDQKPSFESLVQYAPQLKKIKIYDIQGGRHIRFNDNDAYAIAQLQELKSFYYSVTNSDENLHKKFIKKLKALRPDIKFEFNIIYPYFDND